MSTDSPRSTRSSEPAPPAPADVSTSGVSTSGVSTSDVSTSGVDVRGARRGLSLFLALTFTVSWVLQAWMIRDGRPIEDQTSAVLALMWTPALASFVVRLLRREGLGDISLRITRAGGWRPWALAWGFGLVVGGLAYGGAWLSGLETFARGETVGTAALPRFALVLGVTATVGTLLSAIAAFGEELGWRGYMLTRLIDARVPYPILVSGLVWGAWHAPLILSGQYAAGPSPLLSTVMFMLSILPAAAIAAAVRLETGSVWAATLFHAAWNSVIQGAFDGFTRGGGASVTTSIWVGESGVLVVAASVVVAGLVLRHGSAIRRAPRDAPELAIGPLARGASPLASR